MAILWDALASLEMVTMFVVEIRVGGKFLWEKSNFLFLTRPYHLHVRARNCDRYSRICDLTLLICD